MTPCRYSGLGGVWLVRHVSAKYGGSLSPRLLLTLPFSFAFSSGIPVCKVRVSCIFKDFRHPLSRAGARRTPIPGSTRLRGATEPCRSAPRHWSRSGRRAAHTPLVGSKAWEQEAFPTRTR